MTAHRTKTLIIGAGPAGYTAAVYAARANLEPIVVQGLQPGGQLTITSGRRELAGRDLDPRPGADGQDAGAGRACRRPARLRHHHRGRFREPPVHVPLRRRRYLRGRHRHHRHRRPGAVARVAVREALHGAGRQRSAPSATAPSFKAKDVVVVGGGNTAVEDALYLTRHARKVTVVHRRDRFRAEKILQDRLFANPKVERALGSRPSRRSPASGTPPRVTGVLLRTPDADARRCPTDGVFVAIGHSPATERVPSATSPPMPEATFSRQPTPRPPPFPASSRPATSRTRIYRQAVTAAGMGCMAALEAEKFLAEHAGRPGDARARRRGTKHDRRLGSARAIFGATRTHALAMRCTLCIGRRQGCARNPGRALDWDQSARLPGGRRRRLLHPRRPEPQPQPVRRQPPDQRA